MIAPKPRGVNAGAAKSAPLGVDATRLGVRMAVDVDGRELAVLERGDALDLYLYVPRQGALVFALPESAFRRLLWWALWRWWVRHTWCGLRTWWWRRKARRAARGA